MNAPDLDLPIEPVQHIIMKVGEVEMVQDLAVGQKQNLVDVCWAPPPNWDWED